MDRRKFLALAATFTAVAPSLGALPAQDWPDLYDGSQHIFDGVEKVYVWAGKRVTREQWLDLQRAHDPSIEPVGDLRMWAAGEKGIYLDASGGGSLYHHPGREVMTLIDFRNWPNT